MQYVLDIMLGQYYARTTVSYRDFFGSRLWIGNGRVDSLGAEKTVPAGASFQKKSVKKERSKGEIHEFMVA